MFSWQTPAFSSDQNQFRVIHLGRLDDGLQILRARRFNDSVVDQPKSISQRRLSINAIGSRMTKSSSTRMDTIIYGL